jgi:general secretion pathway protein A
MDVGFYGLRAQPFGMAPDPRFFFASEHHRRGLAYLKYGLQQGEGFIVTTGAVGTGKSILAARLLDEIDPAAVTLARIATTQLDPEDALRFILSGFGLDSRGDKAGLLRTFESFLRQESRAGRQVLLVVDEAQTLRPNTLEELRMLSNLGADGSAPLQCFLFGQPQLMTLLARPELEQVRQRIVASSRLGGLSQTETQAYVEHRLTVVGWASDPAFSDEIWPRLHEETGGIPRRINIVCSRLLLYGAIEKLHRLEEPHLEEALRDLRQEAVDPTAPARPRPAGPTESPEAMEALKPLAALLSEHDTLLRRVLALLQERADAPDVRRGGAEAGPLSTNPSAAPGLAPPDGIEHVASPDVARPARSGWRMARSRG